jgi:mannose/cellobiose epimerase-like protein (N-acyl-D-glucosamine 2-epimerase family)
VNNLTQSLTVLGYVCAIDRDQNSFSVRCQSGDVFVTYVTRQTSFQVVTNLDGLSNDRVPNPPGFDGSPSQLITKYVQDNQLIMVQGVFQINGDKTRFDARTVYLLASVKDRYLFEETHWWLTQTARLADQWLDSLFGDKRSYAVDDWVALYRTDLNIYGLPSDDDTQECAVLSRLIYGLSAAYLIVGEDRYREAAAAAVKFQRDAFRSLSSDDQYCFWAYGRRHGRYGTELLVPSQSGDDAGSIPLYEQIYALAGLANYYRISLDWEVLEDIRRTVATFNAFYLDDKRPDDSAFTGDGGYFSHIDYATMRPDLNANPANNLKKNWNSVGDHIPAYLVNLLIALDPMPPDAREDLHATRQVAQELLERVTTLILDKFPDENPEIPYVNERFFANWKPDHEYSWQQNRAIVGHNFKIAWNLTRVANYYETLAATGGRGAAASSAAHYKALAARCMQQAEKLGRAMTAIGVDLVRGGCFDAVEREPYSGENNHGPAMPIEFTWLNTKDFWQQEQAILACLILFGHTREPFYLENARRLEAFWNIAFLDREHRGMYFRVSENGWPVVQGGYEVRGGHSDASGYHCFELNYLAHIYNRAYVALVNDTDPVFAMYFRPDVDSRVIWLNVLPDFMPPGSVRIERVLVNGRPRAHTDPNYFQIELQEGDRGATIAVVFSAIDPKK